MEKFKWLTSPALSLSLSSPAARLELVTPGLATTKGATSPSAPSAHCFLPTPYLPKIMVIYGGWRGTRATADQARSHRHKHWHEYQRRYGKHKAILEDSSDGRYTIDADSDKSPIFCGVDPMWTILTSLTMSQSWCSVSATTISVQSVCSSASPRSRL